VEKEITARRKKAPPTPLLAPPPYCTGPLRGQLCCISHEKNRSFFLSFSIPISNIKEKTAAKSCLKLGTKQIVFAKTSQSIKAKSLSLNPPPR